MILCVLYNLIKNVLKSQNCDEIMILCVRVTNTTHQLITSGQQKEVLPQLFLTFPGSTQYRSTRGTLPFVVREYENQDLPARPLNC